MWCLGHKEKEVFLWETCVYPRRGYISQAQKESLPMQGHFALVSQFEARKIQQGLPKII